MNLTVPEDAKAVIKPWDEREDTTKYADSNVDDQVSDSGTCIVCSYAERNGQVVIHIPFTQNVRLRSISLKLGTSLYNTGMLRSG